MNGRLVQGGQTEHQPKSSKKRKLPTGTDVSESKTNKKQKKGTKQSRPLSCTSIVNTQVETRPSETDSLGADASTRLQQELYNYSETHAKPSYGIAKLSNGSAQYFRPVGEDGDFPTREVLDPEGQGTVLVESPNLDSLYETIRKERLKLKQFGYMTTTNLESRHSYSNGFLPTTASPKLSAVKAKAPTVSQYQAPGTAEASAELDTPLVRPRDRRLCRNCGVTHVAIPNSPRSETCVRISMSIAHTEISVDRPSRIQTALVPTDPYELAMMGWLIWSTYAHQLTLRNATVEVKPRNKKSHFPDDYIYVEASLSKRLQADQGNVLRTKFSHETAFQDWWDGRKNLRKYGGKFWLVITFPWETGDIDPFDASSGKFGYLFKCPSPILESKECPKLPAPRGPRVEASSLREKRIRWNRFSDDEGLEIPEDRAGETKSRGGNAEQDIVSRECKEPIEELTGKLLTRCHCSHYSK